MPILTTDAFTGIPAPIKFLRIQHNDDWNMIGAAFSTMVLFYRPDHINPNEWAANLAAAVEHIDVANPAASNAAVRGWFLAHYPDLMASLTEQEAMDFVAGAEEVL